MAILCGLFLWSITTFLLEVANKLFPMAIISKRIEDFANENFDSVLEVIPATESAKAAEMATSEVHEKHSLLRCVFAIYGSLPQGAKQVLQTPTDGAVPSQDLISSIKNFLCTRVKLQVLADIYKIGFYPA
ncbi:hypothetical protein BRADI_1g16550v3 [Brachypodium distachyon]|uniref:Uncharacterized protein n=1 Tax=Brachypodium distachyon TaxID=15368 RepID=I1GQU5_BRADI|nr:hypothetical protein BRADI_1g16550v3 [Brachypodium distachyon]